MMLSSSSFAYFLFYQLLRVLINICIGITGWFFPTRLPFAPLTSPHTEQLPPQERKSNLCDYSHLGGGNNSDEDENQGGRFSRERITTWPIGGVAVPNHPCYLILFALMSDAGCIPASM